VLPEQLVHEIAAGQHACASIDQALACGLTPRQVHHRFRTGRWERVGRHAFRIAGSFESWEQQLTLALLDLGVDAVVSMRSAAALHGFEGFPRHPVEVTVPRRTGGVRARWHVHTTQVLPRIDRAMAQGFPCTSAARTIIDLAAVASARDLERAIDSAVRAGLTSAVFLRARLTELRGSGRAGIRVLDHLLPDSGGASDLERRFLQLVRHAGLPRPVCQQRIELADGRVARVDFAFPPTAVVVEVSGRRGHASDAERAKDAQRRNELQASGYTVLEFTDRQVRHEPGMVIATLRRHLGLTAPTPAVLGAHCDTHCR
jgi:very-short-patch-repair endonuclease